MVVVGLKPEKIYKSLFSSKETSGIALLAMCLDEFGPEGLEQEPEALAADIDEAFRVSIPQVNFDKIMSLWAALTTDLVHKDVSTFIGAANALSGTAISFDLFDPADTYECAWAITELSLLDPETPKRFSSDVRRYIGEMIKYSGLVKVPPVLRSVADFGADDNYSELSEINVNNLEDASTWYANQEAKSQEIEAFVQSNLISMIKELDEMPLSTRAGDWSAFAKKFLEKINPSR